MENKVVRNFLLNVFVSKGFGLLVLILLSFNSYAGSQISYHGRILRPNLTPVESNSVQFKMQIRSTGAEDCLLYEELKTKDMSGSEGVFSLVLNDGTGLRTDTTGYSFEAVFSNRSAFNLPTQCTAPAVGWTPDATAGRRLVVSFKDAAMLAFENMPVQALNLVPQAIEAQMVGGYAASDLLKVDNSGTVSLTQANLAAAFTGTAYTNLQAVLSGNFVGNTTGAGASLPSVAANPSTPAVGSIWYNSTDNTIKYYDGTVKTIGNTAAVSGSAITGAISTSGAIATSSSVTAASISTRIIDLYDSDNTNRIRLVTPPTGTLNSDYQLMFPATAGAANQVLTTDGSGNLSWAVVSAATGVLATDGSMATPSMAFSGDTDTGLFRPSADTLAVSTSGVEALRVNNLGNVGIGTTSPGAKLDVKDTIRLSGSTSGYVGLKAATNAGSTTFTLPSADGAANQVLKTDGSGNLGWMTASSGAVTAVGSFSGTSTANGLSVSGSSLSLHAADGTNPGAVSTSAQTFAGAKTFTSDVTVDNQRSLQLREVSASGTEYVGLRAPSALGSSYTLTLPTADGSANQVLKTDGAGNLSWVSPMSLVAAGTSGNVLTSDGSNWVSSSLPVATTAAVGVMRVGTGLAVTSSGIVSTDFGAAAGKVTEGSDKRLNPAPVVADALKLVRQNALGDGYEVITMAGIMGSANVFVQDGNSFGGTATIGTNDGQALRLETSGTARLSVDATGNVGIGTTSPVNKLSIAGNAGVYSQGRMYFYSDAGSTTHGNIFDDGNFHVHAESSPLWLNSTTSSVNINMQTSGDVYIANTGKVGIGTTAPGQKLEVAGSALVSGNVLTTSICDTAGANCKTPASLVTSVTGSLGYTPVNKSGDSSVGSMDYTAGNYIRFGHANQSDGNDGKIGAGLFGEGLNIVGTRTVVGNARLVQMWGNLYASGSITTPGNVNAANICDAAGSNCKTPASLVTSVTGSLGYTPLGNTSASGQSIAYVGAGGPEVYSAGGGAAMISFHRPSAFAVNFGLDSDNQLKVGGWSMGAASYKIWHEGNDGAGSTLDADLLDGLSSASFARSDAATIDQWVSFRVLRNGATGGDGMFIGYSNANSGVTRIYSSGSTSGHYYSDASGNILRSDGAAYLHTGNLASSHVTTALGYTPLRFDAWVNNHYFASDGRQYSTIFYDTNDTAYYMDPNGHSEVSRVRSNSNWDGYQGGFMARGDAPSITFDDTSDGRRWVLHNNSDIMYLLRANTVGGGDWVSKFQVHNDGNIWTPMFGYLSDYMLKKNDWQGSSLIHTDGRHYGTIFYDSNDGAYYMDPNGTSTLNNVSIVGNVGIGTAASEKLTVAGTIYSTSGGFKFPDGTTQTTAATGGIPTGAIMAFDLTSCPTGWSVYTAAYGRFLRGIDKSGTNIDPSGERAPGNVQNQGTAVNGMSASLGNAQGYSAAMGWGYGTNNVAFGTPTVTLSSTDPETRPKNVAVLYCRKD